MVSSACLATATASGGSAASRPAIASARPSAAPAATTSVTSPNACASVASRRSRSSTSSFAGAAGAPPGPGPERARRGGVEPLAEQHDPLRPRRADERGEPVRAAAARQDPDADLGQAERRARLGDAEVARERELEPAAQAPAGDRGDRRDGEGGDALVDRPARAVVVEDRAGVAVAELGD